METAALNEAAKASFAVLGSAASRSKSAVETLSLAGGRDLTCPAVCCLTVAKSC